MSELKPYFPHPPLLADPNGEKMPVTPSSPLDMLSRAVMTGASPDTIERLLALYERWEKAQAKKAYDKAIAAAKAELPIIIKNRQVSFGSGRTSYKHEDLAEIDQAITPILSKHGLSYRFRTHVEGSTITVTCVIAHENGYEEQVSLPGPADASGSKNAIQAIGSTVTYLQRYTLKAALGLAAAKDDDGRASGNGGDESRTSDEHIHPALVRELEDLLKQTGGN